MRWERVGITLVGLLLAGLGVVRVARDDHDAVLLAVVLAVQVGAVLARGRGPLAAWAVCLVSFSVVPPADVAWPICVGIAQLMLLHLALHAPRSSPGPLCGSSRAGNPVSRCSASTVR